MKFFLCVITGTGKLHRRERQQEKHWFSCLVFTLQTRFNIQSSWPWIYCFSS